MYQEIVTSSSKSTNLKLVRTLKCFIIALIRLVGCPSANYRQIGLLYTLQRSATCEAKRTKFLVSYLCCLIDLIFWDLLIASGFYFSLKKTRILYNMKNPTFYLCSFLLKTW